jgi:AcrR family transcriptional regulator
MIEQTLWERQRSAARDEISRTALGLFLSQGFDATTIDQIVTAVGVSRRSFFRYFGTKEDIVLGDLVARGGVIAEAVAARPPDEGPWEALRAGFQSGAETTMPDVSAGLALGKMLSETPSLRARLLEKRLRWQELLVPLIAARLADESGTANLRASAIVASALACLDAASEAWIASNGATDLAALYDEAVAAVRS